MLLFFKNNRPDVTLNETSLRNHFIIKLCIWYFTGFHGQSYSIKDIQNTVVVSARDSFHILLSHKITDSQKKELELSLTQTWNSTAGMRLLCLKEEEIDGSWMARVVESSSASSPYGLLRSPPLVILLVKLSALKVYTAEENSHVQHIHNKHQNYFQK